MDSKEEKIISIVKESFDKNGALSLAQTARYCGIALSTLKKVLQSKNMMDLVLPQVTNEELIELNKSFNCNEMSIKLKMPRQTIAARFKAMNIVPLRHKRRRDKAVSEMKHLPVAQIAESLKVNKSRIYDSLRRLKIKAVREKPITDNLPSVEDLIKEHETGLSFSKLGEKYNTSSMTIWRKVHGYTTNE